MPNVEHTAFNTSSANSISLLVGAFCISTSVPLAEALENELKCRSRHKSRLVQFLLIVLTTDERLSASASLTTTTPCSCSFCVRSLRNCMASSASEWPLALAPVLPPRCPAVINKFFDCFIVMLFVIVRLIFRCYFQSFL